MGWRQMTTPQYTTRKMKSTPWRITRLITGYIILLPSTSITAILTPLWNIDLDPMTTGETVSAATHSNGVVNVRPQSVGSNAGVGSVLIVENHATGSATLPEKSVALTKTESGINTTSPIRFTLAGITNIETASVSKAPPLSLLLGAGALFLMLGRFCNRRPRLQWKRFIHMAGIFAALLPCTSFGVQGAIKTELRLPGLEQDAKLNISLLRLISKPGEPEQYELIPPEESEASHVEITEEKITPDTRIFRCTVSNPSEKPLLAKLAAHAGVPLKKFAWWNGYANQVSTKLRADSLLSMWFPVNAAIGDEKAFLLGVHPGEVYSRVVSLFNRSTKTLELEFPLVLDPGSRRTVSVIVSTCPARYGGRDVVQHYYNLFPEWFTPAQGIHPAVNSTQTTYLFWKPENYQQPVSPDLIRRFTGGVGGWEWCYKPFARGGDWAITDKWSLGYQGATRESLENARQINRKRFDEAAKIGVAAMYYLNVFWSEQTLMKEHFPEALSNPTYDIPSWDGVSLRGLYPWKNAYGDLFTESIRKIAENYPSSRGIGWDSTFGHMKVPATVSGVNETVEKSYDSNGKIFAMNGTAYTHLLDMNRSLISDGYRRANAVNLKLVAPYFIGVRSDTALYEGTPVENPSRLIRFELLRARYGSPKILSWHKHLIPSRLKWIKWNKLSPEQGREAYRQAQEDAVFLSYYWSAAPSPGMPALGIRRTFDAVPELIELARLGWQPSPGTDCPDPFLIARYGTGTNTKIVVINPEFESKTAELLFPIAYWNGKSPIMVRKDGKILRQTITPEGTRLSLKTPARSVTILEALGEANAPKTPAPLATSAQRPVGATATWRLEFEEQPIPVRFSIPQTYKSPDSGRIVEAPINKKVTITAPPVITSNMDASGLKSWFGNIPQAEVEPPPGEAQQAAEQVRGWFNAFHETHPDAKSGSPKRIALTINPDSIANIRISENTLTLSAATSKELEAVTLFFLRQMDVAFPYCGVIPPSKDPEMIRLGLPGTVLEPEPQGDFILHPTLTERMAKAFKPLEEE